MYFDLEELTSNKYFLGVIMIIINIGSRFIIEELTPEQKKWINRTHIRRVFIFCIFFMATRDLIASITLTLIFILFISELFGMPDKKEKETDEKEITRTKILDEVNLVLSKYSM